VYRLPNDSWSSKLSCLVLSISNSVSLQLDVSVESEGGNVVVVLGGDVQLQLTQEHYWCLLRVQCSIAVSPFSSQTAKQACNEEVRIMIPTSAFTNLLERQMKSQFQKKLWLIITPWQPLNYLRCVEEDSLLQPNLLRIGILFNEVLNEGRAARVSARELSRLRVRMASTSQWSTEWVADLFQHHSVAPCSNWVGVGHHRAEAKGKMQHVEAKLNGTRPSGKIPTLSTISKHAELYNKHWWNDMDQMPPVTGTADFNHTLGALVNTDQRSKFVLSSRSWWLHNIYKS